MLERRIVVFNTMQIGLGLVTDPCPMAPALPLREVVLAGAGSDAVLFDADRAVAVGLLLLRGMFQGGGHTLDALDQAVRKARASRTSERGDGVHLIGIGEREHVGGVAAPEGSPDWDFDIAIRHEATPRRQATIPPWPEYDNAVNGTLSALHVVYPPGRSPTGRPPSSRVQTHVRETAEPVQTGVRGTVEPGSRRTSAGNRARVGLGCFAATADSGTSGTTGAGPDEGQRQRNRRCGLKHYRIPSPISSGPRLARVPEPSPV